MPSQAEIQKEITGRIIDGLLFGSIPWRKPWNRDPNAGAPANVISKRHYSGINPILLDLVAMTRCYESKWWGTYQQWQSLGAQVKKRPNNVKPGQWGTSVVLWKQISKKETEDDTKPKSFPMLRYFTVFNAEQVEGDVIERISVNRELESIPPTVDFESAQKVIDATQANITFGGNSAFYVRPVGDWPNHTGGDMIRVPGKKQFPDEREFYSTLMHELCHWTECRVGWKGSYEMGELIAEMGAAFLCAQIRIPNSDDIQNHAAYLASWLKALQDDDRAIIRAASQASKVSEFVLSFSRQPQEQVA